MTADLDIERDRRDLGARLYALTASTDAIRDRIATIASEAFGPFPVQTVEEDLTAIEQGISKAHGYGEEWRARAEKAERELTEATTKLDDARSLAGELLESLRLASTTSDGHRDAHAAFQRWAAVHAPDAIGDEQKREVIDRKIAELQEECDLWRDDNVQRSEAASSSPRCRCTAEQGDSKCSAHPSCNECGAVLTEANGSPTAFTCATCFGPMMETWRNKEPAPGDLPILTREALRGLPSRPPLDPAQVEVGHGVAGIRDPDHPCGDYAPGVPDGLCESDGHHLCGGCRHRTAVLGEAP